MCELASKKVPSGADQNHTPRLVGTVSRIAAYLHQLPSSPICLAHGT